MVLLVVALSGGFLSGGDFVFNGCRVSWGTDQFDVGNGRFSATYVCESNVLRTVRFSTSDGISWISNDVSKIALAKFRVSACRERWSLTGEENLKVTIAFPTGEAVIRIWPEVDGPLVTVPEAYADAIPPPDEKTSKDAYLRFLHQAFWIGRNAGERHDMHVYLPQHVKVTEFELYDQTDVRNEVVVTREMMLYSGEHSRAVSCSALDVRDVMTGRGLVYVRLAPMPLSRPAKRPDFVLRPSANAVVPVANGYPLATLAYTDGDAGRITVLQRFQRSLRSYRPGRDGIFLSNTWGGGNRDKRINETFLRQEIVAGARMGVDVIQIDDGWQRGRTANSSKAISEGQIKVWNGYWAADPNYWDPDKDRFPHGIGPLAEEAARHGMSFGLWFGPDSSDDAANWERDADKLLDYHKKFGVSHFKIDSMKLHSPLAFKRNRMFFDKMLHESSAAMVFDLDCTAETRPGFFGLPDIGPLFLENRYARTDRLYWPHLTLRNVWSLSQIVDPVRLRVEILDPAKHVESWRGDVLAPKNWPPDALFAIAMVGSPLAWMELSDLEDSILEKMASLVKVWKQERDKWYGGTILPVGSRPDGVSWTGFTSKAKGGESGYALLFREFSESSDFELDLTSQMRATSCSVIGGHGTARLDGSRLVVAIPERLGFVWVKFTSVASSGWQVGNRKE